MRHAPLETGKASRTDQATPPLAENQAELRHPQFWWTPIVLLIVTLLVTLALIVAASPDVQAPISVVSQLLSMCFCLSCTLLILRRAEPGRERWAWGVIGVAQLLFVIGDVIIIVLVNQPTVSPTDVSLADAFFLPLAPLTAVGAILFPAAQSTLAKQVRIILDVSIVVGALLGLALVFLIAPRIVSGTSADLIFIAYPVTDLTLLLALVVLLIRGVETRYRPVFLWLLVGMVALIYANTAYNYLSLPGLGGPSYTPGLPYVDPFWVVTAFAFSLAPLSMLRQRKHLGPSWAWLDKLTAPSTLLRPSGLVNQLLLLGAPIAVLIGLLLFINNDRIRQGTNAPLLFLTALVTFLIISRQILTQRDLVDARIATARAQQLDALKDQFIASVNHELRTPLMTMQGYIELLADDEVRATPAKQAEMVGRAKSAVTHLVHLVQSILDVRRVEDEVKDLALEEVNVLEVTQSALSLVEPQEFDPTGRPLQLYIPAQLTIWGHPVRIQQVLTNLLSNALKYSPPGSPITVSAHLANGQATGHLGLKTSIRATRPMVEIMVQDQGLGIPPEQQDLLFRRFVRLPREIASSIHGNGLGLYLCRVFVEAMEGRIWIESTGVPGEGSTFHVCLPVPAAPGRQRSAENTGERENAGERV